MYWGESLAGAGAPFLTPSIMSTLFLADCPSAPTLGRGAADCGLKWVEGGVAHAPEAVASVTGTFRVWAIATLALCAALVALPCTATTDAELMARGREIEPYLDGYPKRALAELEVLAPQARAAGATTRHFIESMYGQAMVRANRTAEAQQLADRLENEGRARHDDSLVAMAWLIRGAVQSWNGEVSLASRLAEDARELLSPASDAYVRYWAALAAGTTARLMSRNDDAQKSLQDALALAVAAQSPYRRAEALYQQSVLDTQAKQWSKALEESLESFRQAKLANSAFSMSKAKNAESAALQYLARPKQELEAMQESLTIARSAKSDAAESMALINLADVYLRRNDYNEVLELSQRSLELANALGNTSTAATNKANIGFALLGLGRIESGKRLAEQAVEEYERAGAVAEIGELLVEYGQHLADAGDYKGAIALFDRERRLRDEIAAVQREKTERELRESEKRKREIELLNRERGLQTVELQNRQLQQRIWWLLAAVFAASFGVVAVLYRKLRTTNRLLASKNSELSFQSSRDPLTALYNRRHFQNFINEGRGETDRRTGAIDKPVQALLLIDLDHFKLINDQFGHAAGDAVLIAVARRLRDTLRETDMIVRWGGEEFLVYVPLAPADRLDEIVERIMHAVSGEPIQYMGHYIQVTVSIGYSPVLLPPDDVSLGWERVIGLVDKALYMAKLHGRNRAFGVGGMLRPGEDALTAVDTDLEQAWRDGVVDMRVLLGNPSSVGATLAAPPPGTLKH
jgi:diguanylate cyclase (GGDEF)-like protein